MSHYEIYFGDTSKTSANLNGVFYNYILNKAFERSNKQFSEDNYLRKVHNSETTCNEKVFLPSISSIS